MTKFRIVLALLVVLCNIQMYNVDSFTLSPPVSSTQYQMSLMSNSILSYNSRRRTRSTTAGTRLSYAISDDEEDDDDDEDDYIDTSSLGDWRNFRRNLSINEETDAAAGGGELYASSVPKATTKERKVVSKENEELLMSQNKQLAEEYMSGVWAHPTSTPEVGGLVLRMPMEVEIFRNYKHSLMGRKLRTILDGEDQDVGVWYARAKRLVEDEMQKIAQQADEDGQIDASELDDSFSELLGHFLENQETWQEVCLVKDQGPKSSQGATLLVLNRPMAFKLTENLGKLVLFGAFNKKKNKKDGNSIKTAELESNARKNLVRFMMAFSSECAVYVGGPDGQSEPATMIHGIADLPGATEISPGCGIYEGGLDAAVQGVLEGKYNPLDFRFFVGCHKYEESALDVAVHLGKYQPIACARSVALKQCMSLPKPLWNEVMELCGGELEDISTLELMNTDDMKFQIFDETDYDEEIYDELGLDEEDEDFYL